MSSLSLFVGSIWSLTFCILLWIASLPCAGTERTSWLFFNVCFCVVCHRYCFSFPFGVQGPVVQIIVSLTKSLVEDSLGLTVLTKSFFFYNFSAKTLLQFAVMFLLKNCKKNFCTAKVPHIFFGKNGSVLRIYDIVSFK